MKLKSKVKKLVKRVKSLERRVKELERFLTPMSDEEAAKLREEFDAIFKDAITPDVFEPDLEEHASAFKEALDSSDDVLEIDLKPLDVPPAYHLYPRFGGDDPELPILGDKWILQLVMLANANVEVSVLASYFQIPTLDATEFFTKRADGAMDAQDWLAPIHLKSEDVEDLYDLTQSCIATLATAALQGKVYQEVFQEINNHHAKAANERNPKVLGLNTIEELYANLAHRAGVMKTIEFWLKRAADGGNVEYS